MSIQIQVRNKVAVNLTPEEVIVCGNSGYEVEFAFDAEWASEAVKTARFVYRKGGQNHYIDVEFSGTRVKAPVLSNIKYVLVGVYAGDLITTTPAAIECEKSILCGSGILYVPASGTNNGVIDSTLTVDGKAADAKAVGDALRIVRELLANAVYFGDVSVLLAELDNAIGHANATITFVSGVLTIKANANLTATQSGAELLIA